MTYNWTLDYVNGQQGNVWFGQIKDGSGDWANMTAVDKDGWPNWATHTYYGPGIDAPQGHNYNNKSICSRFTFCTAKHRYLYCNGISSTEERNRYVQCKR